MENKDNKNFWDKSTKLLVLSNFIIIIFAILEGWSLSNVLWIYWSQSIIIGYFNYKRILKLENFTTENFKLNGRSVNPTESTKKQVANFFLMHYGFFHFGYFMFLNIGHSLSFSENDTGFSFIITILAFIASIITFYFNHKASYELNYQEDLKGKVNIGTLMFMPYARIVPMHLIIIFGGMFVVSGSIDGVSISSMITLIFFLLLKTIADVIMHKIEHSFLRKNITNSKPQITINSNIG